MKKPIILVFDSGIGGLSVYDEIRQLLPDVHYIYAVDNEGFPYGEKSDEVIIDRVTRFIGNIYQQYNIDIAVIACNTASTICLPSLRSLFSFPIVGVVPAIKPATKISQNKCIGLLATKATINRNYTFDLIKQFASDCHVELLGLSELAPIAEDKLQGVSVDLNQLKHLLMPWLKLDVKPDTIVLGCTHYPFLEQELSKIFPDATFIDSGSAIAMRVHSLLDTLSTVRTAKKAIIKDNTVIFSSYNQRIKKLEALFMKYNFDIYQLVNVFVD